MRKALKIQDLITIGVYTAIYFLLVGVATFVSTVLLPGFSVILLPGLCALLTGAVYLLLLKKVHKFGAVISTAIVMGLFFVLVGHSILTFLTHLITGIIADYIAKTGNYTNRKINQISFVIFSFGMSSPLIPLWFFKNTAIQDLIKRGKDAAYIENTFAYISTLSFVISFVFAIVCALIGGFIGQKIVDKHFS